MTAAIEVRGLTKTFGGGRKALDGVDLVVAPGEMVALIGASGSGKSTLMRHIGGLVAGDRHATASGTITVNGHAVQASGRMARDIRTIRGGIGFVFQQFGLVNRMSVLTNTLVGALGRLPQWRTLLRWFPRHDVDLAFSALARVGVADWAFERAGDLSGGQQQRVAIARALVQKAPVLMADEPIASLDPASSRNVMEILQRINAEDRITVLVTLHQVDYAVKYCPRTVALRKGRVVYDGPSAALTPQLLSELYAGDKEAVAALWGTSLEEDADSLEAKLAAGLS
ncbi:phosphonate ABC transporter ATP-binding protein [Zavarzinia aquatilis]|uniref:Phosphonate ABC transporter ATP-binding protein n=1 Tax=Zavarzinia aquatilis TaxID=2211142 RepID=A0A317E5G3_9PROT|nr:phosphonate ABC transporter ATP-binding protein [Zavarzinia aquatilis]PWR21420.1 phosphonate ABC transporter ATP-binding protein [Zavarzinia aquatilis]